MAAGKILLARPNTFIVRHMKKLIEDSGNIPLPIKSINEIQTISEHDLKAVVISTSVSSVVAESYFDVLEIIRKKYPNTPVLLASLTEVDTLKRAFHLNPETKKYKLQSVEDAQNEFDRDSLVVIRKNDLIEAELYQKTLEIVKKRVA